MEGKNLEVELETDTSLVRKGTSKNSEQVITCIKVGNNKDIIRTKPDYPNPKEKRMAEEKKIDKF